MNCQIFKCLVDECNREFTNRRSFNSHKKSHKKNIFNSYEMIIETSLQNENTIELMSSDEKNYYCRGNYNLVDLADNNVSISDRVSDSLKYTLRLYNEPNFHRKNVLDILNSTNNFIEKHLQKILNEFKTNPENVEHIIEEQVKALQINKTEYKIFQELENNNLLIKSKPITINTTSDGEKINIELVPLRDVFYNFFNNTNMLNIILNFEKSLPSNTNVIYNILQSKWWNHLKSTIPSINRVLLLPLKVYFDDFEPNNPLGSHASIHKTGAVYVQMPCLPPHMDAKLIHIYLAMLFFSQDRDIYGNTKVFIPLIEELNYLSKIGIKVNHPDYDVVKLITVVIVGDNLGLNSMMGFVESFNAFYYCRFCKTPKCEMQKLLVLNEDTILRDKQNYEMDVRLNSQSLTGIKEESIFNELSFFHITENHSVDLMHDTLEGVCHYVLLFLLKKFILDYKYITLEKLNNRILEFNYGYETNFNKVVPIHEDIFKKTKLKMSASETLMFVKNFGILVGDKIPKDNKEWLLYLKLREILSLILSPVVHKTTHNLLQILIAEHNELYIKLSGSTLQPKFHFLLHYPKIMDVMGSLKQFWSMRFESKHRELSKTAKSTQCRRNLISTMSIKHQLRLAYVFVNFDSLSINKVENGSLSSISESLKSDLKRSFNFIELESADTIFQTKWIKFNDVTFKAGVVLQLDQLDDHGFPIFGLLKHVLYVGNEYFFLFENLETEEFNNHFYAYSVVEKNTFSYIKLNHLSVFSNFYINLTNNELKLVNSITY